MLFKFTKTFTNHKGPASQLGLIQDFFFFFFFYQVIDSFLGMYITSALANGQQWKTLQHGIALSIRSFVRLLKSRLSQLLLQPPSCSTNTIFFSSWNADYSGWTNKTSLRIPSGLNLLTC